MQIVGLVNGNSNNADFQFQTAPTSFINQGVISGLAVTLNQVAVGSALISVTSNGQTWLITFHNTSLVTIDTSGTKKVWIEVTQAKIDNGVSNNEDGTGIAFINTGASYPGSGSYIPLASIASGVITDDRVFISMKAIKRKAMTANRLLYIDASGNEQELPYGTSGQVLTSVNGTTTPIWASPSVDIHGQTQKLAPIGDDEYVISDSENSFSLKRFFRKALPFYYGNGSDGSVTVSTTISLTRDMQYSSLTVTGAGTINTRGYKIFVSGTLTNSGTIQISHGNGGNAVVNTAGVAPATLDSGNLGNIQLGGTGGAGRSGAALQNGASVSTTAVIFAPIASQTSNGGTGGTYGGGPYNGGTGVAGTNTKYIGDITHSQSLQLNQLFGAFTIPAIQYSSSSGGGGGCSVSNGQSGGGGSGGNGGGCVFISAKAIINNNFIQIVGGNGGNGGNATAAATNGQADGGGGGGGGGSGGIIYLLTASLTGTGQVISKGGNGGNGGNSNAAGGSLSLTGGGGGFGGNGGIIVSPTGNTFTVTAGTGGTGGTGLSGGGSGATGTAGVAGVTINY